MTVEYVCTVDPPIIIDTITSYNFILSNIKTPLLVISRTVYFIHQQGKSMGSYFEEPYTRIDEIEDRPIPTFIVLSDGKNLTISLHSYKQTILTFIALFRELVS